MRFRTVRVTKFQSIQDSTEFEIGSVTCLVGKNESGKTAILRSIYRLNPITQTGTEFVAAHDYPRSEFVSYEADVEAKRIEPANVVHATFGLELEDVSAISDRFGADCLPSTDSPVIALSRGYDNVLRIQDFPIDTLSALHHRIAVSDLPQQLASELQHQDSIEAVRVTLSNADASESVNELAQFVDHVCAVGMAQYVFAEVLHPRLPKFMYFDEYSQMKGEDNLDALMQRVENNELDESDYPLLGLIKLAGLKLEHLLNLDETETLIARLEAAGNELTQRVLRYWSQNRHIRLKFDIRPAQPKDGGWNGFGYQYPRSR